MIKFSKYNPYTIQNIKLWCKLNNKPFELLSEEYISNDKDLLWRCLKNNCKEIFNMSWASISLIKKCPYCRGYRIGLSNCLATKRPDLASEWHPTKNGDLTPYDVVCNSNNKVWWKCKICEHVWKASINNRNKGRGCPQCKKSKGEKRIKKWLDNNEIYFISNKEFPNLLGLGNGSLSYDFYLPDYNLLIEYQGMQHEKYCRGFHKSKKDFEKQLEHDRRKREYSIQNNIELLEIWYWDLNNIKEILNKRLYDKKVKK